MHAHYLLHAAGRWNRAGEYGSLFTALSPDTLRAEYAKRMERDAIRVRKPRDRDAIEVFVSPVLELPDKDRPILLAALSADATHLLTGDVTDFAALLGGEVEGMPVERPASYLRRQTGKGQGREVSDPHGDA